MPFAGYLVYLGHFNLFLVATAGAVGCNLGSAVAYWIGAKGGRPLVERYGKWVLMSHHDLDRMTCFFEQYGSITVLLARLLPVVRTFIAFPAGIAKMPQAALSHLHVCGFVAVVLLPGLCGHEAGRGSGIRTRVFMQAFHRFHLVVEIGAAGGNCVVCVVAPEARQTGERRHAVSELRRGTSARRTLFRLPKDEFERIEKHEAIKGRLGEDDGN